MAHLATLFDVRLAIEMQGARRVLDQFGNARDIVSDEVLHHHISMTASIAQRPPNHGADVLFKLVHHATVLGPMARIVHSRRDFIDHETLRRHEQFHAHDSNVVERV